jgi:glyoxylase-like metal-dependent hydrolase (beta-lactamase superfamily II)
MLSRRSLIAAPVVLAAASTLRITPALARAPAQGPSPAVYRFQVGTAEVTALTDGTLDLSTDLFPGAQQDPTTAERLLAQAGRPDKALPTFVNACVVNTGDKLVLVDTGAGPGQDFGPGLGRLPKNLALAGIDPAAVDVLVLTHLHPDHVGGMAPAQAAAFPNAELVVAEPEYAFWTDQGVAAQAPKDFQPFFAAARAAVAPYGNRTRRVRGGEIVPGVTLEPAPGHTPGHSMVRVSSGTDQLLIWGDIIHVAALQFDKPDWAIAFDADHAQAAQTRRRVFDMAAADRLLVAGMHLPFPGVGRVARRGDAYAYVPEPWRVL